MTRRSPAVLRSTPTRLDDGPDSAPKPGFCRGSLAAVFAAAR